MSLKLLIDNWLLQDVANILENGISTQTMGQLIVDYKNESHHFKNIPFAIIEVEALFSLLIDIVTRDELFLDEKYAYVWTTRLSPSLLQLEKEDFLKIRQFDTSQPELQNIRDLALKDLCVTDSLKQVHKRNAEAWNQENWTKEPFLSPVIFGTSENLGRSYLISAPYAPHPFREHFLEQTMFKQNRPDAITGTLDWIHNERLSLFQEVRQGTTFRAAQFVLSPVVIEIIESATTAEDLIPVALQVRKNYLNFREVMRKYQKALDDEDPKAIIKHRKLFDSVSSSILASDYMSKYGQLNLSVGVSWLNWSKTFAIDALVSRFGVRATLKKMILQRKGESSLKKLLKMFDAYNSKIGNEVQEYFKQKT